MPQAPAIKTRSITLPSVSSRVDSMDLASSFLLRSLRECTVKELKVLKPSNVRYKRLVDGLIAVRELMNP